MRLHGKSVLITGAARGLGRATALACAAEGADLTLLDICADLPGVPYPLGTPGQLAHTAALCREAGGAVLTAEADIRDLRAVREAVTRAEDRFGRIDVAVNNAGIAAPSGKPVHEIDEEEWSLMIDVDLSGAWRVIREVGKAMSARRAGSIVNVASTAGLVGYRHFAGYVAAKHAVVGLTKAAALDYAPTKVRVNAVCPGSVRDDAQAEGRMLAEIARALEVPVHEHEKTFVEAQPMNALIEPEDVAAAVVFLASDESRQITGSVLTVDGGFSIR
ncbi:NAD(P)-dependent oxidoreductase [Streptomyces ipomoeae]|jgi:NAD(P)-dependent dehydrogenase (short-subunit alcohol dehydrogenase family)|uniref:Oxidoreductase, short chain dehydrogenase/reductase family protein n=2 Tax=Streptomyces ipomoeae TaxID=103232 RepID=L1L652_9ACTN|nr:SDR family oxidoreductase [Streptomyces ipomoeae]EKX68093.1 oxidoreductase, short chain dehydrogenase/reductase family protein [Streptomyces ipomoeae 91-03]MDX2697424.1 SDR family oxidoreductase [Streptomyces ipomoeae]MDX2827251.1 SDR family oxidoreductase [Streptomyces ipomoeae]MDX2843176.1 SDR family oxidoreductase [Streptomyces ipomoeae]MDX2879873.1 SDR family oxidoreductase [Streptomyces ipomoeae]